MLYTYICIYIYIYIYTHIGGQGRTAQKVAASFGRGDDTVGDPHRGQIYQFELFQLILSLKLYKRLPVQRFEATVSQSTVPSPS